jgi:NitT/TauT family transport system substrate-binding protein
MRARAAFIGGVAASGLVLGTRTRAGAQAALPIRIGATPNDTYAEAYYAAETGIFARNGLTAEVQTFTNGAAVAAAVAGGALDAGVSTPAQLANAIQHGVPFGLVAAGALETPQVPTGLVAVAKSGAIQTAKDLEGKTVAVNAIKTLTEAAFDLWMTRNGADPAKVHVIEMTASEHGAALERGAVDGAVLGEPSQSIAIRSGKLRILGDPFAAVAPRYLISTWFARVSWAQAQAETVKRFQKSIYEAGVWANGHHADSAAVLSKISKMDLDIIRGMGRCPYADALRLSDVQPQLDVALKFGIIGKPMTASELLIH